MKAKLRFLFAFLFAMLLYPTLVQAQKVVLVYGPVTDPPNIKAKQMLKPGRVVSVPEGSLVILEYEGPSDEPGYSCVHWQYLKGAANEKVLATKPNRECPIERNPPNCDSPECMQSGQLYFYEEGKGDVPAPSPRIKESMRRQNELYRALGKLKRNSSTTRTP